MSAPAVETRNDPSPAELSRATWISGLLGFGKLLLLLAPFAAVRSCGGAPTVFPGYQVAAIAVSPTLVLFWLVPLSGLLALTLALVTFNPDCPAGRLRRIARWIRAASAASLVGLANAVGFAFYMDTDHAPRLLWGFWGILGVDLVSVSLLWLALARNKE